MAETVRPIFPSKLRWILDNFLREKFGNHERFFRRFGLSEGMRIMDVGCGPGIVTMALQRIVGKSGWVFAVDINPDMINHAMIKLRNLDNITFVISNATDVPLARIPIFDAIVFYYSLHEMSNRHLVLEKCADLIKPNGLLIITEPRVEVGNRMLEQEVQQIINAGFVLKKKSKTLPFRLELMFEFNRKDS